VPEGFFVTPSLAMEVSLKTASMSSRALITVVIGLSLLTGLLMGCSDKDESTTGPPLGSSGIRIDAIIFTPKSPAPGDTMVATAVVTAQTQNVGDFVKYQWTDGNSDGEFLENDQASVRWVAPLSSSIDSLTVTAKNSISAAGSTSVLFVGQLVEFIDERAGELHLLDASDALYYLSGPAHVDSGLVIRYKDPASATDREVFPGMVAAVDYSFDATPINAAHMFIEVRRRYITVVHDDLVSETQTTIAREDRPWATRASEFSSPNVSPNGQLICYQGGLLDQEKPPSAGGTDTFTVFVYDIGSGETQRTAFEGDNFYPTFSTDEQHLVFVSNREPQPPPVYELYALPMTGSTVTPDTIDGALLQLTDTGGLMGTETYPPEVQPSAWNPVFPVLAVIGTDGKLRIVPTDGSGARQVSIAGAIGDFWWSPDGQGLAVVISDEVSSIYVVNTSGDGTRIMDADSGDKVSDLSWSPDGDFLVYRVKRSSDIWYELMDVEGSTGQSAPVRITGATLYGPAADYGLPLQSFRPGWRSGSRTVYFFFLDRATPRVMSLDLSGIGN